MIHHITDDNSVLAEFQENQTSIEIFQDGAIVIIAPNKGGGLDVIETTLEEIIKDHLR
jgi:virulence-associated protein VagC